MNLPADLPWFDIIVLGIVGFSFLLGMMRGAIQEILSLFSWIGAAMIAWITYPIVADLLTQWLPNALLRNITGGVVAFVIAVILLGIISSFLSALLSPLGRHSADRALGGMFGLLRGYLVACVLFGAVYWVWDDRQPPAILVEGKTRPFIATGAREVMYFLASFENTPLVERLRTIAESGSSALELHEKLLSPETEKTSPTSEQKGYKEAERDALDKLFE